MDLITEVITQGVDKILIPAVDLESANQAIELCKKYPSHLFSALGIHPNHSNQLHNGDLEKLADLISKNPIKAIGEIGLDFYREWSPKEIQVKIFRMMLDLAHTYRLPICIHNRQAENVLLPILDDWLTDHTHAGSNLYNHAGVFHAFDGSPSVAEWAVNHNFKLGICGNITYKNSGGLQEVIRSIDISHFLIETDSPYLTPEPKRGQRNDPGNIIIIANKLSEICGRDLNDVIKITSLNAKVLFNW